MSRRKRRLMVNVKRYMMNIYLRADHCDDVVDDFIYVETRSFEHTLPGEHTDTRNHIARVPRTIDICSTALRAWSSCGGP